MAPLAGIALGVLCALPLVVALRRRRVAAGIGAVLVSFVLFHVAAVVVRHAGAEALAPFGVCAVLAFLAVVTVAALRGRDA